MSNLDWQSPANDNYRQCSRCGDMFESYKSKRFCGSACQRADYNERIRGDKDKRIASAPEQVCEYCGDAFRRRKDKKNAARFCSRECGFAAKSNIGWVKPVVDSNLMAAAQKLSVSFCVPRCICRECGERFTGTSIISAYCSTQCRRLAFWKRRGVDAAPRTCPECDVVFEVSYGRGAAIYCSDDCSFRHNRRKSKSRRRARIRNVANDNINPFYVFARDGWTCQLCNVKTPKKLRGTFDNNAPELDHIIPISLGGTHTLENVQCSCRKCNGAKSNRPMGQLLLFG